MKIISLHHETIYQYILTDKRQGGELYTYLRHQNKTYRKRYGSAHNRTGIPNRKDIDQRPAQANDRSRVGDWEADTIIGSQHQGAIVTLDERKTKLRVAAPLPRKKASDVCQAINSLLEPIKKYVKTITFDNCQWSFFLTHYRSIILTHPSLFFVSCGLRFHLHFPTAKSGI